MEVVRDAGRVVEREPLMFATSINWDEVVMSDRWTVETHKQQPTSFVRALEL